LPLELPLFAALFAGTGKVRRETGLPSKWQPDCHLRGNNLTGPEPELPLSSAF